MAGGARCGSGVPPRRALSLRSSLCRRLLPRQTAPFVFASLGNGSGGLEDASSRGVRDPDGEATMRRAVEKGRLRRLRGDQRRELATLRAEAESLRLRLAPQKLQSEVHELLREVKKHQAELHSLEAQLADSSPPPPHPSTVDSDEPPLLPSEKATAPPSAEDGNQNSQQQPALSNEIAAPQFLQRLDRSRLPMRIFLFRHAESLGNVDENTYTNTPDWRVPLSDKGEEQALEAGMLTKKMLEDLNGDDYRLSVYCSPYRRCVQTMEGILQAFPPGKVISIRQEVQLREQDFGNFQDYEKVRKDKAERLRYGRFFYRFPNGESGADVCKRIKMLEDELVRDLSTGRYNSNTSIIIVSHGLSLRVLLMNWFEWTVDECNAVFNPPNATPIVLERITGPEELAGLKEGERPNLSWLQVKAMYRVSRESSELLKGVSDGMRVTSMEPAKASSTLDE